MKMRKVISAFLVLICLFATFGLCTLGASAAEGARTVYATTNASAKQGSYGYLYVYLDDLTDLSALNVSVYYDTEKITVKRVTNRVSSVVNDLATGDGCVNASYIFDGKGTAAKTNLFYIYYQVNNTAEIGDTYFDIVVNEAYNSSLEGMDFTGSRCSLEITEKAVTKSCSITSSSTVSTSVGEEFELSYRLSTYQIASGSMNIHYDSELFEVVSVTNGGFFTDKIADINTSLDGTIAISFVGTTYQSKYDVVKVRFKTLKNVTETSDIKLVVTDLYDKELNLYSCSGYTTKASIAFDESYTEDAPSMSVSSSYNAETGKVTTIIKLEKDSMLGAGDFVLKFDTRYLTYISAEKGFSPTFFNINDKDVAEGILKFSIISLSDITDEQIVLTVVFDVKHYCQDKTADFEISGSGLTDSLVNTIQLNFVDASILIPLKHTAASAVEENRVEPTCTGTGSYDSVIYCSVCNAELSREEQTIDALGHNYNAVVTAPTCIEKGYTTHTCSRCNDTYVDIEVAELGHKPSAEADCLNDQVCTVCGEVLVEKLGHDYVAVVTAPTCTEQGYTTHTCSRCNDSYIDSEVANLGHKPGSKADCLNDQTCTVCGVVLIEKLGHDYKAEVTAPTCTENGYTTHTCSRCSDTYTDSEVDALGHKPGAEADCLNDQTCTVCGEILVGKLGHDYNAVVTDPTCTEQGYTTHTCSRCNDTYTDSEVAELGHKPSAEADCLNDQTCTVCGEVLVEKLGHDYVAVVTAPTCTENGYTTHTCSRCDDTYVDSEVDALGHKPGADADCLNDQLCTVCGEILNGKLGHTYVDKICARCGGKYYSPNLKYTSLGNGECSVRLGTCTDTDIIIPEFSPKGEKVTRIEYNAFQHCITLKSIEIPISVTSIDSYAFHDCRDLTKMTIPDSVTYIGASAFYGCSSLINITMSSNIEKIGEYAFQYCTSLTDVYYANTKINWAKISLGKDVGDLLNATIHCTDGIICATHKGVIDAAMAPTCTQTGLTEGIHCTVCGEILMPQEPVPALGHKPGDEATCTTAQTCDVCGEELVTALGHKPGVDADCLNDQTCTVCGEVLKGKLGHNYNAVVTAPTCTEQGCTTHTCSRCDDSYIDSEVDALGHKPSAEADCLNDQVCTVCGEVLVDKLGHDYVAVATEPTCTEKGYTTHTCSRCGDTYIDSEVDALGHTPGAEADCLNDQVCTVCGEVLVEKLGHDYIAVVTAPTCTEKGYTTHTCSRCNDTYTDSEVAELGHEPGDEADCLNDQVCTVCGAVLKNKLGHNYNAVVTAPTCTENGYTTHTCSRCSDTYTDSKVDALGHKPGDEADCLNDQVCTVCGAVLKNKLGHNYNAVVTAPTCTEKGYTAHTCSRCNDSYIDSEVDALGHTPSDWIVDQEPAPGIEGAKYKTCTVCGETLETAVIDALPVETEPKIEPATEPETETPTEIPTDSITEPSLESDVTTDEETNADTEKAPQKNGCSGSIYSYASLLLLILAVMPLYIKTKKENE